MERVIERLNLVKSDLKDQILDLTIKNKTLVEIVVECKDEFEIGLLKEDLADNSLIITDSKIDMNEIDQAIKMLSIGIDSSKIEKRP